MSAPRFAAKLMCGTFVRFRARHLVPAVDEMFPCNRHGRCRVVDDSCVSYDGPDQSAGDGRRLRRTAQELLQFMDGRREVAITELRRNRFTLRLVAQAHRDGLIHVDRFDDGALAQASPLDVGAASWVTGR